MKLKLDKTNKTYREIFLKRIKNKSLINDDDLLGFRYRYFQKYFLIAIKNLNISRTTYKYLYQTIRLNKHLYVKTITIDENNNIILYFRDKIEDCFYSSVKIIIPNKKNF